MKISSSRSQRVTWSVEALSVVFPGCFQDVEQSLSEGQAPYGIIIIIGYLQLPRLPNLFPPDVKVHGVPARPSTKVPFGSDRNVALFS